MDYLVKRKIWCDLFFYKMLCTPEKRKKGKSIWLFPIAIVLISTMISGCASKLTGIKDYGDYNSYDYNVVGNDLMFGAKIIPQPENQNFFMNRQFKKSNLLVLNLKMENISNDLLKIYRNEINLITVDGTKLEPIEPGAALKRGAGLVGLRFLFYQNLSSGYLGKGIKSQITLIPREELRGYLFYKVKDNKYDKISQAKLRVFFSHIELLRKKEYNINFKDAF